MSDVSVGQVWEDCDKRSSGRTILVVELLGQWVEVETLTGPASAPGRGVGKRSRIKLSRLRPGSTGYRLVSAPPELFVISRARTHGQQGRTYVIQAGMHEFWDSDDISRATSFTREAAESLLGRGRWAGLDPLIEPAPEKIGSQGER